MFEEDDRIEQHFYLCTENLRGALKALGKWDFGGFRWITRARDGHDHHDRISHRDKIPRSR